MSTTKITQELLTKLVMEEVSKDAEFKEIFGNLFGKKESPENTIQIDNVIGKKHADGNWLIYTKGRETRGNMPGSPNLYWGKVNIFPDGLMIFTFYPTASRTDYSKKQFKITKVERAVQYVADKIKETAEERRAEKDAQKKAEREYSDELTEMFGGIEGKVVVKIEGEPGQLLKITKEQVRKALNMIAGNVTIEINGIPEPKNRKPTGVN